MNVSKSLLLIVLFFIVSCSDKYLILSRQYQFKSKDQQPDYSNLNYWAAHPLKWDPSDSIPKPLRKQKRDSLVDVFFLHPTTYTGDQDNDKLNADIDDAYLNAKTDYSSILYQASVFNQHAKIYAPRFRQAHYNAYFSKDTAKAIAAFDLAYTDVKNAFEHYLKYFNGDRPIIIAAHSQGTTHALRLLKDYFENKPLQKKLVAAYIPGMSIPKEYFVTLKFCENDTETACVCGWRTFQKGFQPVYVIAEKGNSLVTNPLTWKTNSDYASREMNKGSVLYKFNKVYKKTTDAWVYEGVLWVNKPKFPWSFLYKTKDYHIADLNLFYINIQENVGKRINSYFNYQSAK